jgi:hypothetical protein
MIIQEEILKKVKKQFPGARIIVDLKPTLTPSYSIDGGVLKVLLHGMEGMNNTIRKAIKKGEMNCVCRRTITENYSGLLSHLVTDKIPPYLQMKPLCKSCFDSIAEAVKKTRVWKIKLRRGHEDKTKAVKKRKT